MGPPSKPLKWLKNSKTTPNPLATSKIVHGFKGKLTHIHHQDAHSLEGDNHTQVVDRTLVGHSLVDHSLVEHIEAAGHIEAVLRSRHIAAVEGVFVDIHCCLSCYPRQLFPLACQTIPSFDLSLEVLVDTGLPRIQNLAEALVCSGSPAVRCDLCFHEHARLLQLGVGLREPRRNRWVDLRRHCRDSAFDRGSIRQNHYILEEDQMGNLRSRGGRLAQ